MSALRRSLLFCVALLVVSAPARAQDMPGVVLEVELEPAPRAQIAIWLERADGTFLRTLGLTEAVAYRGIGNRPGASQMNSGYRWPYGRREGALPIWASRRAAAPNAKQWRRVIFQNRLSEGRASQTSSDQSVDDYYCLSFDSSTTRRDALDAVSCASIFTSDKGRFITSADVASDYAEPWQEPGSPTGRYEPLSLISLYPPRMDVSRCTGSTACFDHVDLGGFAAHAREVMPEIDAVTMATLPGNTPQSLLFSLPQAWPRGAYTLFIEVNVEGDYNSTYDDASFPTPTEPAGAWDSWAVTYGYPYRGQPSLAYAVPFTLDDVGEQTVRVAVPAGRASWDFWSASYGALESMTGMTDDPSGAPGSGADRLLSATDGNRVTLRVETVMDLPTVDPGAPDPPVEPPPGSEPPSEDPGGEGSEGSSDPGLAPEGSGEGGSESPAGGATDPDPMEPPEGGEGVILMPPGQAQDGPVGPIRDLRLSRHEDRLHSHEWISMRLRAAESAERLHRYEVRVSTEPIVDEASFIRHGRPAKTASLDPEGAVSLMLPVETPAGHWIESELGDLVASTRYYVGVRARDRLNRAGPISVAQITTTSRIFATVTPCFVASAAYGTPLAREIEPLRRLRDRHLQNHSLGRALVAAYYELGPRLGGVLLEHESLRGVVRTVLEPVTRLARAFQSRE